MKNSIDYKSRVDVCEILKAMAHPVRIEIIGLLSKENIKGLSVTQIHESLGLTQPETSKHLSIMRKNEVLDFVKNGGSTYYFINKENPLSRCVVNCICKRLQIN